jgi:hypothetical protein
MKKQNELPLCKEGDMIMDQLTELTSKGCGCLLVVDEEHHLIGTFTDGDLRRTLKASGPAIFSLTVGEMCNRFVNIIDLLYFYPACTNSFSLKYSSICRILRSFQYIWNLEVAKSKQYFLFFSYFVSILFLKYCCFINHINSHVLAFTDYSSIDVL